VPAFPRCRLLTRTDQSYTRFYYRSNHQYRTVVRNVGLHDKTRRRVQRIVLLAVIDAKKIMKRTKREKPKPPTHVCRSLFLTAAAEQSRRDDGAGAGAVIT
jgi:hypothetical protein